MANRQQLERLAGRILVDDEFRAKLFENPERAAEYIGINLTDRQINYLQGLDPEKVQAVVDRFNKLDDPATFGLW